MMPHQNNYSSCNTFLSINSVAWPLEVSLKRKQKTTATKFWAENDIDLRNQELSLDRDINLTKNH